MTDLTLLLGFPNRRQNQSVTKRQFLRFYVIAWRRQKLIFHHVYFYRLDRQRKNFANV